MCICVGGCVRGDSGRGALYVSDGLQLQPSCIIGLNDARMLIPAGLLPVLLL